MPSCPACGGDITHAVNTDGQPVPLEKWTDSVGPDRYRIVDLGPPLVVEQVAEKAVIDGYPDHRRDCPDFKNGLY